MCCNTNQLRSTVFPFSIYRHTNFFKVLRGSTNDWLPHLQATCSMLISLPPGQVMLDLTSPTQLALRSEHEIAMKFFVLVSLWIDILACIATRQKPQLPYNEWLFQESELTLVHIMGCQNWVMKAIGDLGALVESTDGEGSVTTRSEDFHAEQQRVRDDIESGLSSMSSTIAEVCELLRSLYCHAVTSWLMQSLKNSSP